MDEASSEGMLVLFETPAGYALFKVMDEGILKKPDNVWESFETPAKASKAVKLHAFEKFEDTAQALAAATAVVEGKLDKDLKSFLKKWVSKKGLKEEVAVSDPKLAGLIKEKLEINCLAGTENIVAELMRGIRNQLDVLVTGNEGDLRTMALGLAHSLSRYKLKFSPDKVDTMIVQAISLLDDLDKELNTYSMRCREWYGWHFPEMSKLIPDHDAFAKVVRKMRQRTNAATISLSDILPEEMEEELKQAAEISMGTDISDEDMDNIIYLCDQVIAIAEYRTQLYDYLKARMNAVAPNLTCMVGELVGARLISHAGSLLNLAKYPASTVQILGAEKALFRALKTKSDTPKYGLIYHASLVGQSAAKNKGKISRVLAAKTSLSARVDALGDKDNVSIGMDSRAKVEQRLSQLEGKPMRISGLGKEKARAEKHESKPVTAYNTATDSTLTPVKVKGEKRKADDDAEPSEKKTKKKDKESKKEVKEEEAPKKEKKSKKDKESKKDKDVEMTEAKKSKKDKKDKSESKESKKEKKSKKEKA